MRSAAKVHNCSFHVDRYRWNAGHHGDSQAKPPGCDQPEQTKETYMEASVNHKRFTESIFDKYPQKVNLLKSLLKSLSTKRSVSEWFPGLKGHLSSRCRFGALSYPVYFVV